MEFPRLVHVESENCFSNETPGCEPPLVVDLVEARWSKINVYDTRNSNKYRKRFQNVTCTKTGQLEGWDIYTLKKIGHDTSHFFGGG